jgi:hypothetical protein
MDWKSFWIQETVRQLVELLRVSVCRRQDQRVGGDENARSTNTITDTMEARFRQCVG